MSAKPFDGQVALVTGAGSGIGRACAVLLAQRGAAVIVNDVSVEGAAQTVEDIKVAGGRARAAIADVSDGPAISAAVLAALADLGGDVIGVLVNNAGIASRRLPIEDVDDAILDRMLGVHVKGAFHCTQIVLEGMKRQGAGKIVNISSAMGTVGGRSGSHYAAAKGALLSMTRTWARELAKWNIHVNVVAPGGVFTAATATIRNYAEEAKTRVPIGRFGEPEEIASLVAFLASQEANYITGQTVSANGGEFIH
jgi:3-oxoacyl-[acyl-carrier protein] reductase